MVRNNLGIMFFFLNWVEGDTPITTCDLWVLATGRPLLSSFTSSLFSAGGVCHRISWLVDQDTANETEWSAPSTQCYKGGSIPLSNCCILDSFFLPVQSLANFESVSKIMAHVPLWSQASWRPWTTPQSSASVSEQKPRFMKNPPAHEPLYFLLMPPPFRNNL